MNNTKNYRSFKSQTLIYIPSNCKKAVGSSSLSSSWLAEDDYDDIHPHQKEVLQLKNLKRLPHDHQINFQEQKKNRKMAPGDSSSQTVLGSSIILREEPTPSSTITQSSTVSSGHQELAIVSGHQKVEMTNDLRTPIKENPETEETTTLKFRNSPDFDQTF
jgi:hypothetical protein